MPPAGALTAGQLGTFLPYWREVTFGTLLSSLTTQPGAVMFTFQRPLVASLLALATAAMLVVLDTLFDLSAPFR